MKIAIISGSHRKNSESERVSRYLVDRFTQLGGVSPWLFTLESNPLPLWDEGVWEGREDWKKVWNPVAEQLRASDALIVVSPEWSGMVPSGVKNFFLLCSTKEIGHKPGLIVSVSSGMGGAYPVAELRTSSYKNTRICYIPEHIIVRNSAQFLKGEPASEIDIELRKRIDHALRLLVEYGKALRSVRESGVIDYKSFPYGL